MWKKAVFTKLKFKMTEHRRTFSVNLPALRDESLILYIPNAKHGEIRTAACSPVRSLKGHYFIWRK